MRIIVLVAIAMVVTTLFGCGDHDVKQTESPSPDQTHVKRRKAIPEINNALRNIHAELIELGKSRAWLAGYSDQNLKEEEGILYISFYPKLAEPDKGDTVAQQPDHLTISYIPIDGKERMKYWNVFENVAACAFPRFGMRIYGEILVRRPSNEDLPEEIKNIVVQHCRQLKTNLPK